MSQKALIFSASEGHKSLGEAADQVLKAAGWQTKTINLFDQKGITKLAGKMYKSFYRFFPSLFKLPFKIGQNSTFKKEINKFLENYYLKDVLQEINTFLPKAVITTHFSYNQAVALVCNSHIKLFNILPNPWTIHPLEVHPKMINLAYDQKALKICRDYQLPEKKIVQNGIYSFCIFLQETFLFSEIFVLSVILWVL